MLVSTHPPGRSDRRALPASRHARPRPWRAPSPAPRQEVRSIRPAPRAASRSSPLASLTAHRDETSLRLVWLRANQGGTVMRSEPGPQRDPPCLRRPCQVLARGHRSRRAASRSLRKLHCGMRCRRRSGRHLCPGVQTVVRLTPPVVRDRVAVVQTRSARAPSVPIPDLRRVAMRLPNQALAVIRHVSIEPMPSIGHPGMGIRPAAPGNHYDPTACAVCRATVCPSLPPGVCDIACRQFCNPPV
jgi:hypothetical protein